MATPRELPGAAALPMLDVYLPMMRAAAVLAAGELGLFAALGRGTASAAALARRLRCEPHGITRLCDLLVLAGWLRRTRRGYANSAHTRAWFTVAGVVDYTPGLRWTQHAWLLMPGLADALRRGGPHRSLWAQLAQAPQLGVDFAAYMRAFAQHSAPQLLQRLPRPQATRTLLDVGGSHGLHAITWCRAHPGMSAVVFDQASALGETRQNVRAAGLQGRITTRTGDCRRGPFGGPYDVVLLFSVAHNQSAADNRRLFARCARALRPGGLLVVHDYVRGVVPDGYGAAFDLTLLLEVGHRTWTLRDFRGWLRAAGLTAMRHRRLVPAAMGSVLTARRPAPGRRRAAR